MSSLPEYVGTVHIFFGPYRGNPIALYLRKENDTCRIAPSIYPWNNLVGTGETVNKAAADFEEKWKQGGLSTDMYSGPHWEGGIKPERPKPVSTPTPITAPPQPSIATSETLADDASILEKDPISSPPRSQDPEGLAPKPTDSDLG